MIHTHFMSRCDTDHRHFLLALPAPKKWHWCCSRPNEVSKKMQRRRALWWGKKVMMMLLKNDSDTYNHWNDWFNYLCEIVNYEVISCWIKGEKKNCILCFCDESIFVMNKQQECTVSKHFNQVVDLKRAQIQNTNPTHNLFIPSHHSQIVFIIWRT